MIVSFFGPSNSGKTTLIVNLVRHYRQSGRTIAIIKHTHHPLTSERRGDTELFLQAGANEAVLFSGSEALIFPGQERLRNTSLEGLVRRGTAEIILIEGFKMRLPEGIEGVIRIRVAGMAPDPDVGGSTPDAIVSDQDTPWSIPVFRHAAIADLASFLDRIHAE